MATVGNRALEAWLVEETTFYATRFSGEPNLLSFGVGGFNEPFVSQRGSLLCWDETTGSYELAQYTGGGRAVWQAFLARRYRTVAAVNVAFSSAFSSRGTRSSSRFLACSG